MSTERKIDPFAALILVVSLIALIIMAVSDFMGLYLTPYGYLRYSCLTCEYATGGDLAAQIIAIIFFIIIMIVALNDLLPKRLIDMDLSLIGMILALVIIVAVIGGMSAFMVYYADYETWPGTGFYAGIIGGIVNIILFYLKYRNK